MRNAFNTSSAVGMEKRKVKTRGLSHERSHDAFAQDSSQPGSLGACFMLKF